MRSVIALKQVHIIFRVGFALGILSASACSGGTGRVDEPAPRAVRVMAPRVGGMAETLRYVGTVRSRREIVLPARVTGTLAGFPFDEGERVAKGGVLASLWSPELEARVARVEAEYARSRVEADFVCNRVPADENLAAAGALAAQQLDNSRRQCDSARAASRAAEAALREVRQQQTYTREQAPFEGVVLRQQTQTGEPVFPGKPLVLFGDLEFEVAVQVAEEDLHAGVLVGTPVRIGSGQSTWPSSVRSVAPIAGGPGRTVEVRIPLPAEAEGLRHGMSVDIAFVLREVARAVAVPRAAIRRSGDEQAVFLLRGERVYMRAVTPGIEADGWVAVEPPLEADVLIAVGDLAALEDGATVFAVRSDGASR